MKDYQKIKQLRLEKKWTQVHLAEELGVHITHLNRIENGKSTPSLKLLKKVAKVFGVSPEYLLSEGSDYEVKIRDKGLAEIIPLVDNLDNKEREAILTVIEAMLTKQRVLEMLTNVTEAAKEGNISLLVASRSK